MYQNFYKLHKKPFNLTPDPQCLFLSESHGEALNHMLYGIEQREWFIAITGDVGTGKTTICHKLLETLDETHKTIILLNPPLCNKIFNDQSLPFQKESEAELSFSTFIFNQLQKGRRVIVIIDEAQNLSPSVLEHIRIFSNPEIGSAHPLQIILVGQLELQQKLESSELQALNQRISIRYSLTPLKKKEEEAYIAYRLMVAGADGNITFSPDALETIHKYSKGIPRVINLVCDRILLSGFINNSKHITRKIVKQGIKSLEGRG